MHGMETMSGRISKGHGDRGVGASVAYRTKTVLSSAAEQWRRKNWLARDSCPQPGDDELFCDGGSCCCRRPNDRHRARELPSESSRSGPRIEFVSNFVRIAPVSERVDRIELTREFLPQQFECELRK